MKQMLSHQAVRLRSQSFLCPLPGCRVLRARRVLPCWWGSSLGKSLLHSTRPDGLLEDARAQPTLHPEPRRSRPLAGSDRA